MRRRKIVLVRPVIQESRRMSSIVLARRVLLMRSRSPGGGTWRSTRTLRMKFYFPL